MSTKKANLSNHQQERAKAGMFIQIEVMHRVWQFYQNYTKF